MRVIMTTPSAPQGIGSLPRLADWLESNVTQAPTDVTQAPLTPGGTAHLTYVLTLDAPPAPPAVPQALLIAGGSSNLPYRLRVATGVEPAQQLVLRRPPLGHVLP